MNRYTIGKIFKALFRLHYDIRVTGEELLRDGAIHLVMPNHTAYIDPLILFSEVWWLPIRPMGDEFFMRHKLYGYILRKADAIEVPDLQKKERLKVKGEREAMADQARQLSRIAINSLAEGKEICFYPSGYTHTYRLIANIGTFKNELTRFCF